MTTRQLNIKIEHIIFTMINILNFEASNLKIDKKHGKTLIFITLVMLAKSQIGM